MYQAKEKIAHNAAADMIIHSTTPCIRGLKPTECSMLRFKPHPIRNKVKVRPALAMAVT